MNIECSTKGTSSASQGLIELQDKSAALIHDSTYPPMLHMAEYGQEFSQGINMDRGGFGQRADGSRYACLFDGTGGGGLESLYAAQDFTDEMLRLLRSTPFQFSDVSEIGKGFVAQLLTQCSFARPTTNFGDATCVFVDCVQEKQKGVWHLSGGALGDSGIIHIRHDGLRAHLFNTILKEDKTNMCDPGGCVGRYGMLYQPDNICALSQELAAGDFVVLASDGLLDNLYRGAEDEVLSLIVSSPFFDRAIPEMHEHHFNHVPDPHELAKILKPFKATSEAPTALQIATRLNHYIKFITAKKFEAFQPLLQEWLRIQSAAAKKRLSRQFSEVNHAYPGKCDDCLVIALQVINDTQ
ncbi:MAG: hypothetical protein JSR46_04780 [Verrucomicrobia bacterium]|nr:hypothetical protein [Verrucomicrobiota bacterium]